MTSVLEESVRHLADARVIVTYPDGSEVAYACCGMHLHYTSPVFRAMLLEGKRELAVDCGGCDPQAIEDALVFMNQGGRAPMDVARCVRMLAPLDRWGVLGERPPCDRLLRRVATSFDFARRPEEAVEVLETLSPRSAKLVLRQWIAARLADPYMEGTIPAVARVLPPPLSAAFVAMGSPRAAPRVLPTRS